MYRHNIQHGLNLKAVIGSFVVLCLAFTFYPKIRMDYEGHSGIGKPVIVSDPRLFDYPICISNTDPGWGLYRQAGSYTYTLSKPDGSQEQLHGPTPWLRYPQLRSLYCEEKR